MNFSEWFKKMELHEKDNRGGDHIGNKIGPRLRKAASSHFNFFKNPFGRALKNHKKRI
jgi:hypothetical protein